MQTHQEVVEPTPKVATDRTAATTYDPYAGRRATSIKVTRAIYLIFGVIETLLLIRFVLKALGANVGAAFAQLIDGVTGPLIAPFAGLFGALETGDGATVELNTLTALVIYALVAWLVVRAAQLIVGEGRSASVARSDSVHTRAR